MVLAVLVVGRNRDGRRVDFLKFLVGGSDDGCGGRNGMRGKEDGIAVVTAAVAGRRGMDGFAV